VRASLRGTRLVDLVPPGMLIGNECNGLLAIYPRYGAIMPCDMSATLASSLPMLALDRDPKFPAFRPTRAAMGCFVGMLGNAPTRNLPINKRIEALPTEDASLDCSSRRAKR